MSLPLKMMYSKVSSRGGMGRSVGRSSVPKERTDKETARLASQAEGRLMKRRDVPAKHSDINKSSFYTLTDTLWRSFHIADAR